MSTKKIGLPALGDKSDAAMELNNTMHKCAVANLLEETKRLGRQSTRRLESDESTLASVVCS